MDQYKERRQKVLKAMGQGVAILKGAPEQTRTNDTEYPYRQDSDFFYLTGYTEAGAACILNPNDKDAPFKMFVLPKDPKKEVWTGWRLTFEETQQAYGCDVAEDIADFEAQALAAMKTASKVYTNLNHELTHRHKMLDMLTQVRSEVQRSGGGPKVWNQ